MLFIVNRKPQFVTTLPPKVILFEGILVLYNKEIRDLLDMKLFVDCDSDTRLSRRGMMIIDFQQGWYIGFLEAK